MVTDIVNRKVGCGSMGAEETLIQNQIRLGCTDIAVLYRINVYDGKTESGRHMKTAIEGYSDLSGYRKSDGRAVFIEVKTKKGVVSKEQKNFIAVASSHNCLAGVARSVEEARNIILEK